MLFQSISDCSHLLIKHMTNSLLDVGDGRIFSCCFPISNFKNLKRVFVVLIALFDLLRKIVLFGFMQGFCCLGGYVLEFVDEPFSLILLHIFQFCVSRFLNHGVHQSTTGFVDEVSHVLLAKVHVFLNHVNEG